MASIYHWIEYKKVNNKIVGCKLRDLRTGQIRDMPSDELKEKIINFKRQHPNDDFVDNLSLKSDGRFQIKDNILSEYLSACRTIGIVPLEIEKTNSGYVITDIPDNLRNIQIPKFANGIDVHKRFNRGINNSNYGHQESREVSNTDLDIKLNALVRKMGEQVELQDKARISLSEQKGLLEQILDKLPECAINENEENGNDSANTSLLNEQKILLETILEKIDNFKNNQEDSNHIVEEQLTNLKSLMEEIESEDSDSETLRLCEELKNEIAENGRNILDTRNRLETEFSSLSTRYNEILVNLCNGSNSSTETLAVPECAGFISGNTEPCTVDDTRYKEVMQQNNIDAYIPFDELGKIKKWLEYYYQVLTSMKMIIDSTDVNILGDIGELENTWDRLKRTGSNLKDDICRRRCCRKCFYRCCSSNGKSC